jgi:hypothetical protein
MAVESFPTSVIEGEAFKVNNTPVIALRSHNLNKVVELFRVERVSNAAGPDYVKWLIHNGFIKLA